MDLDHRRAGSGEPLVLIHGIGSCWQAWEPMLERLEAHYDVLALSLPGYGVSAPLEGEPTVPALADSVERAMGEVGWETAHVAGWSLGGWIVAELAVRGRARSVTAIAPAGLWTPKENRYSTRLLRSAQALARRIAPVGPQLARTAVGRRLLFGVAYAHPERMSAESTVLQLEALAGSPSFNPTLDWIADGPKLASGLESIGCPFTLVWGTHDLVLPYRQAARWERIVLGARLITLPGAGHGTMLDEPEISIRAIEETTAAASSPLAGEPVRS